MSRSNLLNGITRRHFTNLITSSFTYLMVSSAGVAVAYPRYRLDENGRIKRTAKLGTTFSQLQCQYLGLNYREAFRQICELGFDRIRLCSYWNEIEPTENVFDFRTLDWLLDYSHKHSIEVALTVGMKAPRWPEYHFPDWFNAQYNTSGKPQALDSDRAISDHTLRFIETVVTHTRPAPALKYWQVENEPFTQLAITAGRFLSHSFVRQEIDLVRSLARPGQKILLTNSISLPQADDTNDDQAFDRSLLLADAVGINVYTKVGINPNTYLQPLPLYWQKLQNWQYALQSSEKEHWIAEAQAEPWEQDKLVAIDKADYPSASPKRMTELITLLAEMGYGTALLWGCEYWYWQRKTGNNLWWKTVRQLISA